MDEPQYIPGQGASIYPWYLAWAAWEAAGRPGAEEQQRLFDDLKFLKPEAEAAISLDLKRNRRISG